MSLPPELISLVHHVQLNEAGWWDRSVERILFATLYSSPVGVRQEDLPTTVVQRAGGIKLSSGEIDGAVARMRARGDVQQLPDGSLRISEKIRLALRDEIAASDAVLARVRNRFAAALKTCGCSVDPEATWNRFVSTWLFPIVSTVGARTYQFLNGQYVEWESARDLKEFLGGFASDERPLLRSAVSQFLDPKDEDVRAYILRLMDAYFVVESSGMQPGSLDAISRLVDIKVAFTLFLDTNVVLSILGLHGERAQEAAESLLELTKRVSAHVKVRVCVVAPTVDEAKRALASELRSLREVRMTPQIAAAVAERGGVSGMVTAFANATISSGRELTAQEYFHPYVKGLLRILKERGVKLFNDRLASELAKDPEVVRDVEEQLEYEQRVYGDRAKSRDKLTHDVALWHFTQRKRPIRVDNLTEAQYWIVTEDGRALAFDRAKRRPESVPICVQPLALAQLFQFWIGRTSELETALLGGLRLTLLVPEFDSRAEAATVKILALLSRFENLEDVSQPTMAHLLVNDALQRKISETNDEEEQLRLIREAVLEDNRRLEDQLTRERTATGKKISGLGAAQAKLNRDLKTETSKRSEAVKKLGTTEADLAAERAARQQLEGTLEETRDSLQERSHNLRQLRDALHKTKKAEIERVRRKRFLCRWILLPIGLLATALWVMWIIGRPIIGHHMWRVEASISILALGGWLYLADGAVKRLSVVGSSWFGRSIHRMARPVTWVILAVIAAVVGAYGVEDLLKPLFAPNEPMVEIVPHVNFSTVRKTLDSIRANEHLRPLQLEEGQPLVVSMPRGTFGFLLTDTLFRRATSVTDINSVRVASSIAGGLGIEVHRGRDGQTAILGFSSAEEAAKITAPRRPALAAVSLSTRPQPLLGVLILIPVEFVRQIDHPTGTTMDDFLVEVER